MTKKLICSVCGKTVTEKELKEYYNDKTVNDMMNGELEVICPLVARRETIKLASGMDWAEMLSATE